jgi:hypothetical protein
MKNILIPRKDHEIYFIQANDNIKRKDLRAFISNCLRELHPGFSPSAAFDFEKITFKDKIWYVVTVLQQETLMEYRLLHRGASFFTATGLLVHARGFIEGSIYHLTDETIGYDLKQEMPVSVPGIDSGYTHTEPLPLEYIDKLLEHANRFQSIFRKKQPFIFFLLPAVLFLTALVSVPFFYSRSVDSLPQNLIVKPEEEPKQLQPLPTAFELLARIASVVQAGDGIIQQVQYDESQPILLSLYLSDIEPSLFFERVAVLSYIKPSGVSDIRYIDNTPQYVAYVALETSEYRVSYSSPLFEQERLFAILSELRNRLRDYNVQFVSETLPQAENPWGAVALSISAYDFIQAIEIIEKELDVNRLCIRRMAVSFVPDNSMFLLTFSFSPYQENVLSLPLLSDNKTAILPAFGYMPAPVVQKPAARIDNSIYTKIGVIHDEDGKVTTYYKDEEGKIFSSEENQ